MKVRKRRIPLSPDVINHELLQSAVGKYRALQSSHTFQQRYLSPETEWLGYYNKMDRFIEENQFAMFLGHPGCGKSTLASYIKILKEICKDRSKCFGIFSRTAGKAGLQLDRAARTLKLNQRIKQDFGKFYDPNDPSLVWNKSEVRVIGSSLEKHTPTLTNIGQSTQFEMLRFDGILLDDPIDIHTAMSRAETMKMIKLLGSLLNRLDPGGWLLIIGRLHLANDFYQLTEEIRDWIKVMRLPAVHVPGNPLTPQPYSSVKQGVVMCPELWTSKDSKLLGDTLFRDKYDKLLRWEWETGFQQIPTSPEDSTFSEILRKFEMVAPIRPFIYSSADPAYSKADNADYSVAMAGCKFHDGVMLTHIQDWKINKGWTPKFVEFAISAGASIQNVEINNAATLGQEMRDYCHTEGYGLEVLDLRSKGPKEFRIGQLAGKAEKGRVYFLHSLTKIPAFQTLMHEWTLYPNVAHDDHLDCLDMLFTLITGAPKKAPPSIGRSKSSW